MEVQLSNENIFLRKKTKRKGLLHHNINIWVILKCIMELNYILMAGKLLQYLDLSLNILDSNGKNHLEQH